MHFTVYGSLFTLCGCCPHKSTSTKIQCYFTSAERHQNFMSAERKVRILSLGRDSRLHVLPVTRFQICCWNVLFLLQVFKLFCASNEGCLPVTPSERGEWKWKWLKDLAVKRRTSVQYLFSQRPKLRVYCKRSSIVIVTLISFFFAIQLEEKEFLYLLFLACVVHALSCLQRLSQSTRNVPSYF